MTEEEYVEEEPESPEEAIGLMVGRLHPKEDIPEYLTILKKREAFPSASLAVMGEVLKEANAPSAKVMHMLNIDSTKNYTVRRLIRIERQRLAKDGVLVDRNVEVFEDKEVDARAYTVELIRKNRGIAQALTLLLMAQKYDNYRVSKEGLGRMGGIKIASSMVTGKQESSMGVLGRFRRALGQ